MRSAADGSSHTKECALTLVPAFSRLVVEAAARDFSVAGEVHCCHGDILPLQLASERQRVAVSREAVRHQHEYALLSDGVLTKSGQRLSQRVSHWSAAVHIRVQRVE